MIDSGLLKPGEIDFNQLNDVFIIVISPFDLFGKGRYVYSFGMNCKEDQEVWLEDGAVRIFLNTHGKDDENITPELKELLHYMEHSDSKTNSSCMSEKIHRLHGKVQAIKDNEEVGVRYMQEWEERAIEIKEAREEARKEEKKNTERERRRADQEKQRLCKVNQLNKKLAEEGRIEDIVKAASDTEYQQQLIDKYNL